MVDESDGVARPTGRRDRILLAAEAEFAARGIDGARIDRIATAARVNKQLLFHYFGSKAGLFRAAAESASRRHDPSPPAGETIAERLRNLADALLVAGQASGSLLTREWRVRATGRAARVFADGQGQGFVRDDIDPAALSELLVTACLGWASNSSDTQQSVEARYRFRDVIAAVLADFCVWR